MSDTVNKIALFPFDVPIETGLTMGWGSQKHSSTKNVFSKSFRLKHLSRYLQSVFMMIGECKVSVDEKEDYLLIGYGQDNQIHTSLVNILKFISHK